MMRVEALLRGIHETRDLIHSPLNFYLQGTGAPSGLRPKTFEDDDALKKTIHGSVKNGWAINSHALSDHSGRACSSLLFCRGGVSQCCSEAEGRDTGEDGSTRYKV